MFPEPFNKGTPFLGSEPVFKISIPAILGETFDWIKGEAFLWIFRFGNDHTFGGETGRSGLCRKRTAETTRW